MRFITALLFHIFIFKNIQNYFLPYLTFYKIADYQDESIDQSFGERYEKT